MSSLLLFQNPNLRRLLTANLLSGIGDWFNSVAVLSLLLEVTGTAMAVGITLALRTLPHLFFGPVGGMLSDRYDRKTLMIVCDGARAVIALSFLLVSSASDAWIIYAGTFFLVAFSSLYNPARLSILPQIVQSDELASANALDQSLFGIVMAVGSLFGGIFVAIGGTDIAFVCNSLSFLASGCLMLRLGVAKRSEKKKAPLSANKGEESPQHSYRSLLRDIAKTPIVCAILLLTTLWPIGGGILNVLISVYAYQVFDTGKMGVGLLYGAIGLGFIAGGFLVGRFSHKSYEVASCSFAAEGFAFLLTSFSPTIYVTALCYALSTVAGGMGNASLRTLLMKHVRPDYHGRVFALEETVSNVLLGISMLAGGWLLTFADARIVGFAAGVFVTVSSIFVGRFLWNAAHAPKTNNHARMYGRG